MVCVLYILVAALPLHLAPQGETVPTNPFTMTKWEMFKRGTTDGHLAYIRGNVALRGFKERERFPYRIGFAVAFQRPNRYGLPTDEEARELAPLENEIERTMSGKRLGFLALVITTGGTREYVFYSNQPDAVRRLIKKMGGRVHGREFRSYVTADPGWDVYFRFTQ
jgi:hypothetical protein